MAEKPPHGAGWKMLRHFVELQQAQPQKEHYDATIYINRADALSHGWRSGW